MGNNLNGTLCEKYLTIKGARSCYYDFCDKLVCILCIICTKLLNAMNEATMDTSTLLVACQKAFRTIKKEIEDREKQEENNNQLKDMVQRFDALSA